MQFAKTPGKKVIKVEKPIESKVDENSNIFRSDIVQIPKQVKRVKHMVDESNLLFFKEHPSLLTEEYKTDYNNKVDKYYSTIQPLEMLTET